MSRFNRVKFYETRVINSLDECDFILSDIQDFKIIRPTTFYTIRYEDIQRPELLAYKLYGNQDYWWILMYVNEIHDVWNDITEGKIIKIPNIKDINEWYLNTKRKK